MLCEGYVCVCCVLVIGRVGGWVGVMCGLCLCAVCVGDWMGG